MSFGAFPNDPGLLTDISQVNFPAGWREQIFPFVGGYNLIGTWPAGAGVNNTDILNGVFQNTSAAQNDAISYDVFLPKGTYSLDFFYRKIATGGIATFSIDGGAVGTVDTYNAATADNNVTTLAGIVVPTTGKHTITVSVPTKNGASAGFVLQFQYINLRKTA